MKKLTIDGRDVAGVAGALLLVAGSYMVDPGLSLMAVGAGILWRLRSG